MQDSKIREFIKRNIDFIITLFFSSIAATILSLKGYEVWFVSFVYFLFYTPIVLIRLKKLLDEEELEDNFSTFLVDLSQYLDIGLDIKNSLKQVSKNSYGKRLDYEIKKMISEMEYGLTFIEAFRRMAERTRSERVKKIILNITETELYGGDINKLLKNLSKALDEILYIKKNRISKLRNLSLVFYSIYLGLLGIIILSIKIVSEFPVVDITQEMISKFKLLSFVVLLNNSIFTGLLIGRLSYGSVYRGMPHSIILSTITAMVFMLM